MNDLILSIKKMIRRLVRYFNLRYDAEDPKVVHNEILKGVDFIGTNLWILFFAVIIASVGLNINSTAVIIGAMLISPLMGPINGMGYALATYDFPLFRRAVKNYTFAVITGLLASTLYFIISPVSSEHSELLARTSPTIYDVFIAFFGGLAGIVAVASKIKGNVIPGVAIATALMPPLCTAGFGIANGKPEFFFGAMYLFTINTVFIAVSAILVSRFFDFSIAVDVSPARKVKIKRIISAVIIVTLVPSIFLGVKLVKEERFKENANVFINSVSVLEYNFLLDSDIKPSNRTISLYYTSDIFSEKDSLAINECMNKCDFDTNQIIIKTGLFEDTRARSENANLKSQVDALSFMNTESRDRINFMNDSIALSATRGIDMLKEIKPLYSGVTSVALSEAPLYSYTDEIIEQDSAGIVLVMVKYKGHLSNADRKKIKEWFKVKLENDNVEINFIN
jgi:uncharacterized hydrophobic protein (TIGR00271 family)